MNSFMTYLQNNGTKILGIAQGTIATLSGIAGIIPASQLKYWLAASAVITFWRGFGNTQAIATAVTQQHVDAIVQAVQTSTPPVIAPAGNLSSAPVAAPAVTDSSNAMLNALKPKVPPK